MVSLEQNHPLGPSLSQGFRELQEGQEVNVDVAQGQKGPQVENITPA